MAPASRKVPASKTAPAIDCYDRYWKLKYKDLDRKACIEELVLAGYPVKPSAIKAETVPPLRRRDCGLPCYHKYTDDELTHLLASRGIRSIDLSKKQSIAALEEYDANRLTFHRFLDLPAELRVEIYGLAMSHHPPTLYCPTAPPLSRVCRQLRAEALPIFYRQTVFRLAYNNRTDLVFRATMPTTIFLSSLPKDGQSHLLQLEMWFHSVDEKKGVEDNGRYPDHMACQCDVRYCATDGKLVAQICRPRMRSNDNEWRRKLEERLNGLLKEANEREGVRRLSVMDVDALRREMMTVSGRL